MTEENKNPDTEYLWHYTTCEGLKGILESQCLKATDARYTNDEYELIASKDAILKILEPKFNEYIKTQCVIKNNYENLSIEEVIRLEVNDRLNILYGFLDKEFSAFILSLSIHMNHSLINTGCNAQWRAYGGEEGYAFIFDKRKLVDYFLNESSKYEHLFYDYDKCYYVGESFSQEVEEKIESVAEYCLALYKYKHKQVTESDIKEIETKASNDFFYLVSFIKDASFIAEKEFRFIFIRPNIFIKNPDGNKPKKQVFSRKGQSKDIDYIKFFDEKDKLPIKKIMIDSRNTEDCESKVSKLLKDNYLTSIEICRSQSGLRNP